MSSLWACCCIQSPHRGGADVLADGSPLDLGPTMAGSQDSCLVLVMVVSVIISHKLDSWTERPGKSRCRACTTWFCCPKARKSQCFRTHPGLCLWNSSPYCTKQQAQLYLESGRNIEGNVIHKHFWLHHPLEIQAFLIYLLPICLPSSFYAHLRYASLSGFHNRA